MHSARLAQGNQTGLQKFQLADMFQPAHFFSKLVENSANLMVRLTCSQRNHARSTRVALSALYNTMSLSTHKQNTETYTNSTLHTHTTFSLLHPSLPLHTHSLSTFSSLPSSSASVHSVLGVELHHWTRCVLGNGVCFRWQRVCLIC